MRPAVRARSGPHFCLRSKQKCVLRSSPKESVGGQRVRGVGSWIMKIDLSVENPNGGEEITHRSPKEIMDEITAMDAESAKALATIRELL